MSRRPLVYSLGALLLASLGLASAQDAYTSRPVNVHAGPDREYPLVAQLDAGAPLDVHGCLEDWSWCDVSFEDSRGWVYAGGISFVYQGGRVPVYSYGPRLGLPIITFSLMSYWGNYYRGRPWYAQRDTWSHRTFAPHTRPGGRPHGGPPPVSHERPMEGGRAEERGHAAQSGGRSHAGPPAPVHEQRPPGGSRPEPRNAPAPRSAPTPRSGPPPGSHPEPRASQHGHMASPGRSSHPENRKPGSRPPDHPPQ